MINIMFYVYLIHNILNNKVYVGKTNNPLFRWGKHLSTSKCIRNKEKYYLHRAIAKHGKYNFQFSIIQQYNNEKDVNLGEIYWIKFFQSKNNQFGYNLTDGGEGASGRITSEVTRQKMREKAIGRKHTEETKQLLREINRGKIPYNLERLKVINVGRILSEDHRKKISEARQGMKFTEEHKNNMSKSQMGLQVGEKNAQAKLNETQVIEIKEKYNSGNYTQRQLADEYDMGRTSIRRILDGDTWKHLLGKNE